MVYPIVYLIVPVNDVINFFIASLLFSAIVVLSEKWKDKEKEILPEWESEESAKVNQKIKEIAENRILGTKIDSAFKNRLDGEGE